VVFLDTNLYIALIKSNDNNYPLMRKIISQPHLSFVTSTATLVELSSVMSREYDNLQLDHLFDELEIEKNSSILSRDIILFLIDYLISKTKTTIIPDPQIELLNYFPQEFMINPTYKIAILESTKIRLRTLDLIHYACSVHYNTIQRTRIDYILSGDRDFISNGRSYIGTKDFTFIDPETIIKLECN
jgi:predicted nucleic acid-binding protein